LLVELGVATKSGEKAGILVELDDLFAILGGYGTFSNYYLMII
jgi:hypothetical protein